MIKLSKESPFERRCEHEDDYQISLNFLDSKRSQLLGSGGSLVCTKNIDKKIIDLEKHIVEFKDYLKTIDIDYETYDELVLEQLKKLRKLKYSKECSEKYDKYDKLYKKINKWKTDKYK
jgi:hypothetical protein